MTLRNNDNKNSLHDFIKGLWHYSLCKACTLRLWVRLVNRANYWIREIHSFSRMLTNRALPTFPSPSDMQALFEESGRRSEPQDVVVPPGDNFNPGYRPPFIVNYLPF